MAPEDRKHILGEGGECICPKCENRIPHRQGVRCHDEHCPQCGVKLLRIGSDHYQSWLEDKGSNSD